MCHAMHTWLIVLAAWTLAAVVVTAFIAGAARLPTQVGCCPTCEHPWSKHWDEIGCFIDSCPCPRTPPGPRPARRARHGRWI